MVADRDKQEKEKEVVAKVFCLDEEHGESDDSEAHDSGWEDDDDDSEDFSDYKSFSQKTKNLHVLTCRYYHVSLQLNDEVGLNGVCDR